VKETRLREQVATLVEANLPHESRIRLIMTRSTGEIFIGIQPFTPLNSSVYTNGVQVITSELSRSDPRIKDSAFITASANQRKQLKGEIFEVLLYQERPHPRGDDIEFLFGEGKGADHCTEGCLAWRYPQSSPEACKRAGDAHRLRAPVMNEIIDEAFLTSSSRGVVPIVSIDHVSVGEGRAGAWTKSIMRAYGEYVEERSESLVRK